MIETIIKSKEKKKTIFSISFYVNSNNINPIVVDIRTLNGCNQIMIL